MESHQGCRCGYQLLTNHIAGKRNSLTKKYSLSVLLGVLEAPSPRKPGLTAGGVCTLDDDDPDGFLVDIGADIDGLLFATLNGLPSSESRSPVDPPAGE